MIGAVLAGGAGRRIGGDGGGKATLQVAGRPLVTYPLGVLRGECDRVAVVCKRHTALPPDVAAERWNEPDEPQHPLTGILHALERAGSPVLVCAADMPFVTAGACRRLIAAAAGSPAAATVAAAGGALQPVLAVYDPSARDRLLRAPGNVPLKETVEALGPTRVELPEPLLRSVNTRADALAAEALLRRGHRRSRR